MQRWSAREDNLLGTNTDAAIAERLGRTPPAVETRRRNLGIAAYTQHWRAWTAKELALLGAMSDQALADKLGCRRLHVLHKRQALQVAAFAPRNTPKKFRTAKKSGKR